MKIYIRTLGCPKNFNDSEGIAGICENAGISIAKSPEDADVILVNTCAFINDAKVESIDTIFDMVNIADDVSETRAKPMLIVCGCLGQRYGNELAAELSEADVIMGVNDYEKLPEIIANWVENKEEAAAGDPCSTCSANSPRVVRSDAPNVFTEFSSRRINSGTYSATLRIAEGCNNRCAYCVIPEIRGGYRSRPIENILKEAEEMASSGVREIMLTAQDVTEYGRDLYGRLALPELLRKLCRIGGDDLNKGFRWIRLMYCYEDKITDELIDVIADEERICNYIDIPIQHISDNVLRGMRRRSTSVSIRNTLSRLRKKIPDIHIRTTLITGFPGETDDDFEELCEFVEEFRFERLGVFAYSREEGTAADMMGNHVPEEIKQERADSIMRMQMEISREKNIAKKGRVVEVLVDDVDEDGSYIGRTMYDAPEIDNTVIFDGSGEVFEPGSFAKVQILDAFDYDLVGIAI